MAKATKKGFKMILTRIQDLKAKTFTPPMASSSIEEAKRQFTTLINQEGNFMHDYPSDFVLWHVGDITPDGPFICLPKELDPDYPEEGRECYIIGNGESYRTEDGDASRELKLFSKKLELAEAKKRLNDLENES